MKHTVRLYLWLSLVFGGISRAAAIDFYKGKDVIESELQSVCAG